MRAASRAAVGLVVVLGPAGALSPTAPAAAEAVAPSGPRCPATVADQPLSITVPFSGTVRPRADGQGRIESSSLLCAYGEGVAPAAEVTVRWATGPAPCATTEVAVAPTLDGGPFDALAADLASSVGTTCGASSTGGWLRPALAGGLVVGGAIAALGLRRRRAGRVPAPLVVHAAPPPTDDPPASPVVAPSVVPEVGPVLAALTGAGGRAFAHTGAGQLAVLAAVAYGSRDSVTGDLARAGSLAVLPVGLRPRAEVAALAWDHAHQDGAVDR